VECSFGSVFCYTGGRGAGQRARPRGRSSACNPLWTSTWPTQADSWTAKAPVYAQDGAQHLCWFNLVDPLTEPSGGAYYQDGCWALAAAQQPRRKPVVDTLNADIGTHA